MKVSSMSNLKTLSDDDYHAEIRNASRPVLIDFSATWCGPCKAMAPAIEDLAREYADEVDVYVVDIDACPKVSSELGVRSVPTFMVFSRGDVVERIVGSTSRSKLAGAIETAIEMVG